MKICHMTSAHGVEDVRIFHKECISLSNLGYEVYLVERGDTYDKEGVHVIGVGEIGRNRWERMKKGAASVYKKAVELDCDVYHLHDPELLPYGYLLKKKGKIVIFDSHEMYREQFKYKPYLPKVVSWCIAFIYSLVEDYILGKIDGVIVPCTKDGSHPFEGKCKNIATVDNYSKLEEMYDKYEFLDINNKIYDVCYIGGLTYSRGITHLIKACYNSNVRLVLAGSFSSNEYETSVKTMKEYECVDYKGVLSRNEVFELLKRTKIGAATLLNEGQYNKYDNLPTKVYEYMSMGLPSIITKSKYSEAVNNKYNIGICVEPDSISEITDAIQLLLSDFKNIKMMGDNGRMAVRNEFNWNNEEIKLYNFYKKCIGKI